MNKPKPPRRRLWQLLCRTGLLLVMLVVAAYVTLPWWLPTEPLRRYLADEMSRMMGVGVRIAGMSVSWLEGVELRELTIDSPEEFGPEPMAFIERVRGEFSPANLLANRRIAWMAIDRPRLFARVNEEGRSNVEPLAKLKFDVDPDLISVHQACATLRLPRHDRLLRLDVGDMQVQAGRLQSIGQVTMSATLCQNHGLAPVSLYAGPGSGEDVAGIVSFNIANVDLDSLGLPRLLGLPLERLAGRCSGSLDLQVNQDLVADRLSLSILVRGLDVQPASGPKLPVIDEAHLRVTAAYDPLASGGGRIELQSVSVRLPGLDLAGRAVLSGDIQTVNLESVASLEMQGAIHPMQLAAVLTGQARLPDDLATDGPLRIEARLAHDGPLLNFDLALDGTETAITRAGEVAKPRGRPLRMELAGQLDERSWKASVRNNTFLLGTNRFIGQGVVQDVRKGSDLFGLEEAATFAAVLEKLPALSWQGSWEVRDVASLREFWPPLGGLLTGVALDGPVTGGWVLERGEALSAEISLTIPSSTRLAVGEEFVKPDGAPMSLTVAGTFEPSGEGVTGLVASVAAGDGSLGVREGHVRVREGDVFADGLFTASRIDALLACLANPGPAGGLAGRADGTFSFRWNAKDRQADITAELPSVDLAWRPPADGPAGAWGRALGGTVRGRTRLEAKARRSQDRTDLELSWDARDLEYVTAGENRRRKAAGVPLNLVLSGQLTEKDGRIQQAVLRRATLEVGGSQVSLVGRMGFAADGGASGGWGGMGLKDFDASADVQCVLDDSLKAFVPELVDLIGRHGLSGQVGATIRMAGDSASASLEATVDADRLAAGEIGPFDWGGKANLGPFRKPAGMTAFLKLEATVPSDLATMQVNNLRVRLDDLHLLAGGSAALRDADGRRTLRPRSAHAAVWTKRVEDLPRLVPELQPYALAGDAILEMEWKDGSEGRIEYVTFSTTGLSGRLGGKDVRMSGQIVLEGLRRTEAGLWELGRMAADGLELQAGNNRVWVVADVKDLPAAPKGTFHLLAEALDGRDLSEWLSPGPASGADKGKRRSKLLREETEALQKRAEKVLADLRPHLLSAGLTGRISIGELTTLDETVGQSIVARNVEAICAVDNGHLTVQYVAGLYGGCLRTKLDVHLADAIPLLAQERELQDVIATDPMQVQLARYFPGNRVNGAFNRQEKTTAALRDVVANTLDSRYVLHPEGESVTVTLDGVVTGRAAPVFVTRLLPGLNLATYSYKRMTGFATYRQNGTAVNDMVFDGYAYDMYMEGTTSTDNIGEYEVGVILLGTPQSAEFNHVYRQGRIPILKVKARIENGRMYDQEVTYPLPTETAYVIFLKNNVFYRIWLASKQK